MVFGGREGRRSASNSGKNNTAHLSPSWREIGSPAEAANEHVETFFPFGDRALFHALRNGHVLHTSRGADALHEINRRRLDATPAGAR